jgi:hypothetical protein
MSSVKPHGLPWGVVRRSERRLSVRIAKILHAMSRVRSWSQEKEKSKRLRVSCSLSLQDFFLPPHTRGILYPLVSQANSLRITPAYAGNTTLP